MDEIVDITDELSLPAEDMNLFNDVDEIVARAVTIGDPQIAFEFGARIGGSIKARGLAMAKLLYRLQESWELFRVAGIDDDFETMAFMHMGIRPETNKKYVRMWDALFEGSAADEEAKKLLRGRNMTDLLKLTAAVREGSISGDALKNLALTVSSKDLPSKIREARGAHTSSASAMHIYVQMQDTPSKPKGTVWVEKEGQSEVLFVIRPIDSDLMEHAIDRIIERTGMEERYGV